MTVLIRRVSGKLRGMAVHPLLAASAVGLSSLVLTGCGDPPAQQAPQAPVVIVQEPVIQDVTDYYQYTGTMEPVEQVEIRARVAGYLEEMTYTPATKVDADTLLFRIEPEPYELAVNSAKAEVVGAEAKLEEATVTKDRTDKAAKAGAAQASEVLAADAQVKLAQANVQLAKQTLAEAELNLSYTYVRSPIAGRASRTLVDVGNLVGTTEATHLTTVTQMDPIWAYFDVSERIVLEYLSKKEHREGDVGDNPEAEVVEIALASSAKGDFPFKGRLDWVDNQVDQNTGTIRVRGVFPNEEGRLFPGLFIRARVAKEVIEDAKLVPENAITQGLEGAYLLIVKEGNIVERRAVVLGPQQGELRVIAEGLEAGEKVVVVGMQKAAPGKPVQPKAQANVSSDGGESSPQTPEAQSSGGGGE